MYAQVLGPGACSGFDGSFVTRKCCLINLLDLILQLFLARFFAVLQS